ncbi:bcl-2-like protein 15 [Paramormyrops kingsleyae]|uniref:bcl-2-like protein 15 n=1 Tax=Paramormyrops kingsleyae TaxID=1676925 RepID=UPI003B971DAB
MAPRIVEEQTKMIINCLFEDAMVKFQCMERGFTEADGIIAQCAGGSEDAFDPKLIAEKLRSLGDDYDETVLQPLMNELQKAAVDKMQTAFKSSVEHLCESWVTQSGGVAVEPQLLKAAITLGLYVKKKSPDLSAVVQGAMATFINTNLANWVFQQGGWAQVTLD